MHHRGVAVSGSHRELHPETHAPGVQGLGGILCTVRAIRTSGTDVDLAPRGGGIAFAGN